MYTFTADFSATAPGTCARKILRVLGAKNEGDALQAARRHLNGLGMPRVIVPVPLGTPLEALRTASCTVAYVTAMENLYQMKEMKAR